MTHLSVAIGFMLVTAGTLLALGLMHLLYTFRGTKLQPFDPELLQRMPDNAPVMSRQTTM